MIEHIKKSGKNQVESQVDYIEQTLKKVEGYLAGMTNPFRKRDVWLTKEEKAQKNNSEVYVAAKKFFETREKILPKIKEAAKELNKKRVELINNPVAKTSWKLLHGLVSTIRNYWEVITVAVLAVVTVVAAVYKSLKDKCIL